MNQPEGLIQPVREPEDWSPDSWQRFEAVQQANYPDADDLQRALTRLKDLPPLVTSWEVLALREQIAEAQRGERFLLQGGQAFREFFAEKTIGLVALLGLLPAPLPLP